MNIIIITGASSGMGEEFALQLDNKFHNIDEIWLIARRKKAMLEVAQYLDHTTRVLDMDVTKEEHIKGFKNAGYEVYSGKPGCGKAEHPK